MPHVHRDYFSSFIQSDQASTLPLPSSLLKLPDECSGRRKEVSNLADVADMSCITDRNKKRAESIVELYQRLRILKNMIEVLREARAVGALL